MEYVYIVVVVAFGVIGLIPSYLRWRFERAAERPAELLVKQARAVELVPISRLGEATLARTCGEVKRLDAWIVSPISKHACVSWRVAVSQLEYDPGARGTWWRPIFEAADAVPFVVQDHTGACVVDPACATIRMTHATAIESGRELPEAVQDFIAASDVPVVASWRTRYRFEERTLDRGARVSVTGVGTRVARSEVPDLEHDYRSSPPSWIRLDGRDTELLISDERSLFGPARPGRGTSAAGAWGPRIEPDRCGSSGRIDVEEFEAALRRGRRRKRTAVLAIGVALISAAAAVVAGHLAGDASAAGRCDVRTVEEELEYASPAAAVARLDEVEDTCGALPAELLRRRREAAYRAGLAATVAADTQTLMEHASDDARVWAELERDTADRGNAMALARQGIVLARESRERHELVWVMEHDACELDAARIELGELRFRSRACGERARGRATIRLGDPRIEVRFASQRAHGRIEPRVGTTTITAEVARRANIELSGRPSSIVLDGRVVRGELAVAAEVTVAGTSTSALTVLIVPHLPGGTDAVIGIDYLWRFDRAETSGELRLSARTP